MTTGTEGSGGLKPLSLCARARMEGNRSTLRDPPAPSAREHFGSSPAIQNQSLWVKAGDPICLPCHWSITTQGHEINCEVPGRVRHS
jgi:hypothetical protein